MLYLPQPGALDHLTQKANFQQLVMGKIVYYKDIDLLRALAVIAVVTFHFNEAWLPSGYLGVDLFFVISGFVITLQITKQHKEDSFSVFTFFQRRIKRILPLVTAVVLCTLIVSPFIVMRAGLNGSS